MFLRVAALMALASSAPALADQPPDLPLTPAERLTRAKTLMDDLELEAAIRELDAVDKTEGLDRKTVLEVLTLQGVAWGTLDKEAKVRDAFRKLAMLDPAAKLPSDVPPRVRTPFFEAREWAAMHGPTSVSLTPLAEGGSLSGLQVSVTKDVYRLAKHARFVTQTDGGPEAVTVLPLIHGRATLPVDGGQVTWRVDVLNERQSVLMATALRTDGEARAVVAPPEPVVVAPEPPVTRTELTLTWRRPLGVALLGAAAVTLGVGIGFGVASADLRASVLNASTDGAGRINGLTQRQAYEAGSGADRAASIANVLYAIGGGLAAVGLTFVVLGPAERTVLAITPGPAGLSLFGAF